MNLQRDPDGVLHIVPVSGGHDSTCTAMLASSLSGSATAT